VAQPSRRRSTHQPKQAHVALWPFPVILHALPPPPLVCADLPADLSIGDVM
jgi:hypothetical protein